ncbi:MAG: MFS transporter, partial [Pseudomonadota bacterium]
YYSSTVVGESTMGQILAGSMIAAAGVVMAFVAPVLGAMIDQGGYRKPPTFAALAVLAGTSALLWFVTPATADGPGAVWLGFGLMALGYCAYTVAELFHNAMLPMAGRSNSLPVISGIGLAMGNFGGILALILITLFLTGEGAPDFGFDRESSEHIRIIGPLVALWIVLFIGPFFFFMPDIQKTPERSWSRAAKDLFTTQGGLVGLGKKAYTHVGTLFRTNPNVMRFLVGRMIYADGIAALLTMGAVYVRGYLGWSADQAVIFNIVAASCAVIGALTGGIMDRYLGPKKSIIIELSVLIAVLIFQFSLSRDTALFGLISSGHVVWPGSPFETLTDVLYLVTVIPAGLMLGACISSSRYMLVHIAPPEQIGQFFGFYAMAGSVTVWMGPGLVALMTALSGDLRIGMSALGLLFVVGLTIILGVKADKTPEHLKRQVT